MKNWRWEEGGYTVTRSTCWSAPGTHGGCGVLIYSKDNRLVKIEGDPDSPHNQGRACAKTLSIHRFINHPERLKYPLKRSGRRGEAKWERISWGEAIDSIVEELSRIKMDSGPESVIFMQGTGRDTTPGLRRLAFSYGSPNFANCGPASGLACYWPKIAASSISTGARLNVADMSQFFSDRYNNPRWHVPKCILVWGNNPTGTCSDLFFGHWVVDCLKRGSEVIVIDPRCTWMASRAKKWLQIRPGTDAALALGMLNVIIDEELYDKEFVDKWTHGFDQLKERIQKFSPKKVAQITWIPGDLIEETARIYAKSKPSCIQWGVALDQTTECLDSIRALISMMAITDNFDVPGGNVFVKPLFESLYSWSEELISNDLKQKKFGVKEYPIWSTLPNIQPDVWIDAMAREPYPTKAAWIQGTNTFTGSFGDPKRVYDVFKRLQFVVLVDLFMTPTAAAFADIILPASMFPEKNGIKWFAWDRLQTLNKAIDPPGECKSDLEIDFLVGKKLNPAAWPWNNEEELLDDLLKSTGMTFKELREKGPVYPEFEYRKYEKGLLRSDKRPGFETPTGKIELYSTVFENLGYDPLPKYEEPPISPVSTPELAKEYPLLLTTGARLPVFFHSEHRQFGGGLREIHPDPLVELHPETAKGLGIRDGDWVWIENHHGRCRQKAKLTPMIHPKLIHAQHSWWYPEKPMEEPSLGGIWESNINLLLPTGLQGKTGFGYPFKVNLCKIYREEK